MNMEDVIYKKRQGGKLTKAEIEYFVEGYTGGSIPDYQASALLMAIFFQRMDKEETFWLTMAMKNSGDVLDLSAIKGIKVDKHSTGGVGDKTTLVVGPLAAACGVPIAKMSGSGLGFTGGTVDKLHAIPGFRTTLSSEEFTKLVNNTGISVIGQTAHITPADKKIYALRDVTATVDNLSLITSSIMSKKLAAGSDAIVLDVKCGSGAFMQDIESACELGSAMVEIGNGAGRRTVALVTDMEQPLGRAVGNASEVKEAIETLKGRGPRDITELSLTLAGVMIYIGGKAADMDKGRAMAETALGSGQGLSKLSEMIAGQGGDARVIEDYTLFPQAKYESELIYKGEEAYVSAIAARSIGIASQRAGAGRATKEDEIDLAAGVYLHKKVGEKLKNGDVYASIYGNDRDKLAFGAAEAEKAFCFSEKEPAKPVLIKKIIGL